MKKFALILLALLLVCTSAMAESAVRYEGGAEKFVFLPGSEYSDTDLFPNFKNVLPGDVLEQTIHVENSTDGQVRIYMRAEGANNADQDFLNQMQLTVKAGDSTIFDAQSDEKAKLTENTLLGTFKKNGGTDLVVTLTVPIEMGNEYMSEIGVVPWTFMVEKIEGSSEETPETGDWFDIAMWSCAGIVLACAILMVLAAVKRKKRA